MKRLTIVLCLAFAFIGAIHQTALAKSTALDGRLGGTQASFEKRLGKNTGRDEKIAGFGYESSGYGLIVVSYASSNATLITLEPQRSTHVTVNEADAADWTESQWEHVVQKFLPTDTTITDLPRNTDDGRQEGGCRSNALGAAFSAASWKKLHASGKPGDCHFLLSPDAAGNVYRVEIGIGQSGSLNRPVAVSAPTPTATASAPSGYTDDEKAYLTQVGKISSQVGHAITDVGDRFQSSDIGSQDWIIHVAVDFVAVRDGYQQALALTPPPAFADENALFVQALSYANDATYDYQTGIDNIDAASIDAGNRAITQAATLINQANDELDRIRKEREG